MTNRNVLYLLVGGLIVIAAIVGYQTYQSQQAPGIDINIGKGGLSIQSK